METFKNTSEIVESLEEFDPGLKLNKRPASHYYSDARKRYSIEDDINNLFQVIDNKSSCRSSGQPHVVGRDTWQKSALKRPIGVGSHMVSSIGISEPVSLKQALRGLCISQAAEMAAMKRQSRPVQSLGVSETVAIKRLYRTRVVEGSGSGASVTEGKGKMVEISLVPERITLQISNGTPKVMPNSNAELFNPSDHASTSQVNSIMEEIIVTSLSSEGSLGCGILEEQVVKQQCAESLSNTHARWTDPGVDKTASSLTEISRKFSMQGKKKGGLVNSVLSRSGSSGGAKLSKSSIDSTRLIKPVFLAKSFVKKKAKIELTLPSSISSTTTANVDKNKVPIAYETEKQINECSTTCEGKENEKVLNVSVVFKSGTADTNSTRHGLSRSCCNKTKPLVTKSDESSRSKGEFSQSSESSIVDYSSSPSISRENIVLGSSRSGNRPHMSKDLRWEAIHQVQNQNKILCLTNFKMLRRLGLGDIGTVYLAELSDTNCLFAMKVMDNEYLTSRKKTHRAQTEKEILHMLDHPFLPTLYTHFETDKFTYFVIDYCPGGDLHVLRQKQPSRNFSEQAVRFYVAEVLLALEYLHMLGVIYRDLKPENILIREDGHIMLTDFDSSLRCAVNTMVLKSSSPFVESTKKSMNPCDGNSCIHPLCLQPSWQVPCFSPKLLSTASKSRKIRSDPVAQVNPLPQLVVEPISARSNSLVGTHEYLAPEIIKSEGHGNAVDWWTYGIFLFELLYGKTPFKGSSNEETLANIVSQSLRFPDTPMVSFHARDLIRSLLIKEPENRLGSVKGAAEIKQHSFFDGLNWALIRCTVPPELPKVSDKAMKMKSPSIDSSKKESLNLQVNENAIDLEDAFGLF